MAFEIVIISGDIIGLMTIHSTHIMENGTLDHNNDEYKMEYEIG